MTSTAFQSAVERMFDDPNIAQTAVYRPAGGGDGRAVRVVVPLPDETTNLLDGQFVSQRSVFELRVSEVAAPAVNDEIDLGGQTYRVQGPPERRDPRRLVWTLDCVAI